MTDNLWARGGHPRHRELYDAEYAKQLERIARIRSEVSAGLPDVPAVEPPPPPPRPSARWDAAPTNLPPAEPRSSAAPSERSPAASPGGVMLGSRDPGAQQHTPSPAPPADRRETPPRRPGSAARDGRAQHRDAPRRPRVRRASVIAIAIAAIGGASAAVYAARSLEAAAATVFRVPGQPTGLVADGGRVWVAGPLAGEIWVLDGDTGQAARPPLRVGGTPARLALDRRFAWIADTERGAVVRAPLRGSGAPRPVPSGPDVADVAVAGGAVYTASSADGTIRVIGADGRRRALHVGARPVALAADERRVVAADAGGAIIRLDARTARLDGPAVPVGGAPSDIALQGDRAWIADTRAGTVQAVALRSGITGPALAVGRSPVAIAADRGGIFVLCRGDRTLVELDAAGHAVRSRRRLDHSPTALALDSRHVWIAAGDHEVIRVDR